MGSTKPLAPLGLVLRGLRALAGITLRAHAARAGLNPGHLSKVERGAGRLSADRQLELITALSAGPAAETQARLALGHGEGFLTDGEVQTLLAYHGARPVICLYRSHLSFGETLPACVECGETVTCRPAGHVCPNGCGGSNHG